MDAGRCLWYGDCLNACPKQAISFDRDCPVMASKGSLVLRREAPLEVLNFLLKDEVKKVLGRSLAIREVEVNSLYNPIYDLERFGIKIVASPRHAGRLVTGPVTRNMEGALMKTYLAAPEPRLVAAMDTCVISGGPFGSNHASGSDLDSILPVDVYIPGCPPNPRTVILGLLEVLGRL